MASAEDKGQRADVARSARDGRTVFIESLGCAANRVDGARIQELFVRAGWRVAEDPADADLAVVQTCGFTQYQENESTSRLDEIRNALPHSARLVIGGCLPGINPAAVGRFDSAVQFGPRTLDRVQTLAGARDSIDSIPAISASTEEPGMAVVRAATGCLDRCAYCAIPFANGRIRSRTRLEVERDLLEAVRQGYSSAHLTGEDIGAWGRDRGEELRDLLRLLVEIPLPLSYQLDNLNANWLVPENDEFYDLLCSPRILPRYHIPAQSGSDVVLHRMRRRYSSNDVREVIARIRSRSPEAKISTDILVGFPGETESQFAETRELLLELAPDFASIYVYEDRRGTEGASMSGKLPREVRERRTRELIAEMVLIESDRLGLTSSEDLAAYLARGGQLPINTNLALTGDKS